MKKGDIGAPVTDLQRRLGAVGLRVTVNAIFDDETESAVQAFQRRAGLIADGIAGPKTLAALLSGDSDKRLLNERDLVQAADRLGVNVAAVRAINAVESTGPGFLPDGRAKILFERHQFYRQLGVHGIDPEPVAAKYSTICNPIRGGYVGNAGEYTRLAMAMQIHPAAAQESCSWGAFQVMGYHWQPLGYDSIEAFVFLMNASEAAQLEAFTRFIESDPALLKALKGAKWPEFARRYNGPAYKDNLYDVKLARAFEKFQPVAEAA